MDLIDNKNIVFLVQTGQHYKKLYALAATLKQRYNISFLLDEHHFSFDTLFSRDPDFKYVQISSRVLGFNHFSKRRMPGVHTVVPDDFHSFTFFRHLIILCEVSIEAILSILRILANKYRIIKKSKFRKFFTNIVIKLKSARVRSELKSYFKKSKYDFMIIAESNIEYANEFFVNIFKKSGKPVIVYPYTFCTQLEAANSYKNSIKHRFRKTYEKHIGLRWIYKVGSKHLIRMPIRKIIVLEMMKAVNPMPWVQESTFADKIIAESSKIKTHYIEQGIPQSQIALCGDINHDIMYEVLKNKDATKKRIFNSLGLNCNNKTVLFAVFPNLMDTFYNNEFNDYHEIIQWIVDKLTELNNFNILVCLHPTLNIFDFNYLETDRIKLSRLQTSELLPLVDLYVASASASIKMAISLGVPVINFDVYNFSYDDYLEVKGVVHLETKTQFSDLIKQVNHTNLWNKLYEEQNKIKNEWGLIDGKAIERFHQLLVDII